MTTRLQVHDKRRRSNIVHALRAARLSVPRCLTRESATIVAPSVIDQDLCIALSKLVSRTSLTLEGIIALWRDQTPSDPRPNKALDPVWLDILLHGYQFRSEVVSAAAKGVPHHFDSPRAPDSTPARNHSSAHQYCNALENSIADGQAAGTYLVLTTEVALQWNQLRFSPFGCVPKRGANPATTARLIHDLSFPDARSVNARSRQDCIPPLAYESVRRIAARIEELAAAHPHQVIKLLKGDVKSAFRRIAVAASLAAHFCGSSPGQLAVVDLALPFRWTGSPAYYGVFGEAISFLIARESPHSLDPTEPDSEPFFSYVWVDDHILVEIDCGSRLCMAEAALRLSMVAVLGPGSINEDKFSTWSTQLTALGLLWDTARRTVAMPPDKIRKALRRIEDVIACGKATRIQLEKLLGSLRHIGLCCRASRAFIQRLHSHWLKAPRFGTVTIPAIVLQDLSWVESFLLHGGMNEVSLSVIADTLDPAVHLFMDASDTGLCVLYPSAREFIRVQFDDEEIAAIQATGDATRAAFSINVREMLSAVLAVLVWGARWGGHPRRNHQPLHIRCWIDNVSAVSWINRHTSSNILGQELVRVLSCAELEFGLHVSTQHLPGASNVLADLGSRAWDGTKLAHWTNCMSSWCQQEIPSTYRKIYNVNSRTSNGDHSQTRRGASTSARGNAGVDSAPVTEFRVGSPPRMPPVNPYNSLFSRLAAGKNTTRTLRADSTPFGLTSAILSGVIKWLSDSGLSSNRSMSWPFKACAASVLPGNTEQPSQLTCSASLQTPPTCPAPSTASFVGLRCWASFFCLRGAEFLSSRGEVHIYCLQVGDVSVADSTEMKTIAFNSAASVRINLRGSKTDQSGQSTSRLLLKSEQAPVCPVFAALLLLRNAAAISLPLDAPLCSINRRSVLSADTMTKVLRKAAVKCNIQPDGVSTHSLRTGGATALHDAGIDADTIRMHGRWASDAYQLYVREAPAAQIHLARRMGRTARREQA